ncbi:MAG TPA: hypothetical protein VLT33_08065 [Labilithrix sp.]|nr:hypothetical protein [Labilithrix sp.]
MRSSRPAEDRDTEALVAQIAQLRARIAEARAQRDGARSASEQEETAALRERIAEAKAFIAKQSQTSFSVEKQARRTRLLVGIGLAVLGVILVVGFWRVERARDTAEEGLGMFYLIFGLPLLMGVVMVLQSRYSAFRNGSLDSEDS